MKRIVPILLLICGASSFVIAATAADIKNAVVLAKVIGPNKSTPETAAPGTKESPYFWTTIKVLDTMTDVGKELKGREIKLRTGPYQADWLGRTMLLALTRTEDEGSSTNYSLVCTDVGVSNRYVKNVWNTAGKK